MSAGSCERRRTLPYSVVSRISSCTSGPVCEFRSCSSCLAREIQESLEYAIYAKTRIKVSPDRHEAPPPPRHLPKADLRYIGTPANDCFDGARCLGASDVVGVRDECRCAPAPQEAARESQRSTTQVRVLICWLRETIYSSRAPCSPHSEP